MNAEREKTAWKPENQPAWLTAAFYAKEIHPRLAEMSNSMIAGALGATRGFAEKIRRGYRPHPRHWQALEKLVGAEIGRRV